MVRSSSLVAATARLDLLLNIVHQCCRIWRRFGYFFFIKAAEKLILDIECSQKINLDWSTISRTDLERFKTIFQVGYLATFGKNLATFLYLL